MHLSAYNLYGSGQQTAYGTSCLSPASYYTYEVKYIGPAGPYPSNPGGHYSMRASGVQIQQTNFDPWTAGWSFSPQIYGEGQFADSSNIPGLPAAEANIISMQIQSVDTGAYRSMPCYLLKDGSQHPRYKTMAQPGGCTSVYMYTG